ncbi:hypothetical protein LINPERHAP2_LOCUS35276 [Linum perenne]
MMKNLMMIKTQLLVLSVVGQVTFVQNVPQKDILKRKLLRLLGVTLTRMMKRLLWLFQTMKNHLTLRYFQVLSQTCLNSRLYLPIFHLLNLLNVLS